MTLCLSLLLCLLCLAVSSAEATIYYLKPSTGLDTNNGTSTSTPWKTFTKAKGKTCGGGSSACLAPGDTLRIMGGTYTATQYKGTSGYLQWKETDNLGTAGNPITITNNPGETAIFDGQTTENYAIWFQSRVASYPGHYIVIDGTNKNLVWQNYNGVSLSTRGDSPSLMIHHLTIQNTLVQNDYQGAGAAEYMNWNAHHIIWRSNKFYMAGVGADPPSAQADHALYVSEVSQYTVIENNDMQEAAGYSIHMYGHGNYNVINNNNIVRRNVMVNNKNACILLSGSVYNNNYVYNNTCYNIAAPRPDMGSSMSQHAFGEHLTKNWNGQRIINNIFDGYWSTATFEAITYSQLTTNLTMDYNMWGNLNNAARLFRWDADSTTATYYNLAGFQAATIYEDHGKSGNPSFVNPAAKNFTLAPGSVAIDGGRFLTTAVGAGVSSTTLTVADAGYFCDGFGMVTGDTIKIGAAAEVTITAVNNATNVITLSAARSWSNGDGVNLPFSGSAPDMGAFESPTTTLVFTTQPVSTQVGQTMANVVVTEQDGAGSTITSFVGSVVLSKLSGPGTLAGTLTKTAVAGVATFNDLTVDTVGTYTLLATATGATSGTSLAFDGTAIPVVPVSGVIPLKITRIR